MGDPSSGRTSPPLHRVALGRRVKALREQRGLSQERLAEAASGLDRSYLAEIETGVANPTVDVLHRLAAGLRVDIADLFGDWGLSGPAEAGSCQPHI